MISAKTLSVGSLVSLDKKSTSNNDRTKDDVSNSMISTGGGQNINGADEIPWQHVPTKTWRVGDHPDTTKRNRRRSRSPLSRLVNSVAGTVRRYQRSSSYAAKQLIQDESSQRTANTSMNSSDDFDDENEEYLFGKHSSDLTGTVITEGVSEDSSSFEEWFCREVSNVPGSNGVNSAPSREDSDRNEVHTQINNDRRSLSKSYVLDVRRKIQSRRTEASGKVMKLRDSTPPALRSRLSAHDMAKALNVTSSKASRRSQRIPPVGLINPSKATHKNSKSKKSSASVFYSLAYGFVPDAYSTYVSNAMAAFKRRIKN